MEGLTPDHSLVDTIKEKNCIMLEPGEGLLTFRAEGNNMRGNSYYSREIHWPGVISLCDNYGSGVTIGRGYDMKHRSRGEIISDLTYAGISLEKAKKIAEAAKMHHCKAGEFVRAKKNEIGEITESQQLRLFELVYKRYVSDSIRFYNKFKKITSVSWDKLHPALKDVLIDMRYQGRLHQEMIAVFGENNKTGVINLIKGDPRLRGDERARNRIGYMERFIK